jgi:hypothetical protein
MTSYLPLLLFMAGLMIGAGGVKPNIPRADKKYMLLVGATLAVIALAVALWERT